MKDRQKSVTDTAVQEFKDHVLVPQIAEGVVRSWLVHKEGTGIFHFWVVVLPYTVAVMGDIGDNIINVSDRDSLSWVLGVCGREPAYYDYAASKIRTGARTFDIHRGKAWLEEELKHHEECAKPDADGDADAYYVGKAKKIKGILEDLKHIENEDHTTFYELCQMADLEPEDVGYDYTHEHYWTIECLRAFARLYLKQEELERATFKGRLLQKWLKLKVQWSLWGKERPHAS